MIAEDTAARARVVEDLARLFDSLAGREDVRRGWPGCAELHPALARARERGDEEELEGAVLRIYCLLHGGEAAYAPEERRTLDRLGGYWCHAGGLEPLVRAAPFIGPQTRLADYGAGNGLQGLLLQSLYRHRRTTLIELSGPMIARGRVLQECLGIPAGRVEWVHGDVRDVPPREFDFVYLYRPMRPEGPGRAFYEMMARELAAAPHPVTVFSVADCLKDFLGAPFRLFHDDGQLACFSNLG